MSLTFNTIPLDIRTPGQFIEFDATRAMRGLVPSPHRVLICGQKLAAGVAVAGVPIQIRTEAEAIYQFGRGSQLARMFRAFKAMDPASSTWAVPLADNAGGVAATGTLLFAGPATAAGSVVLYIAGQKLAVAVTNGQSATSIGAAVATAINAALDLPVTAVNTAGSVALTCRHKGTLGNDVDLRANYQVGEALPAGVTLTVTAMANGATNPDSSVVFTAIGDSYYDAFIWAWTDATNLTALETALATRWGPTKMLDGVGYAFASGNYSALNTLGVARNSPYVTIGGLKAAPTPPWELAAVYGAQVSYQGSIDPARPFQTLPLPGVLPPAIIDRFTRDERDLLLHAGISTFVIDSGDNVLIERPISTYQLDAFGLPSTAFLDVTTVLTLAYLRFSLRARMASRYPRHKLADDGTAFTPGQPIVTPSVLRGEIIAWFGELEANGLVEGVDQFKADLKVERDASNRDRVNALIPPDIINGFRVFAAQIQFLL